MRGPGVSRVIFLARETPVPADARGGGLGRRRGGVASAEAGPLDHAPDAEWPVA